MASQVAKNAPCPCGSGKKYKNCCLPGEEHTKITASPERVEGNPASATQGGRFTLLLILAVIAVGVVIYSNTLHGPFVFDDTSIVALEGRIQLESSSPTDLSKLGQLLLGGPYLVEKARPVVWASFVLNYYFGGLNTFGYHLVNLLIHLLTAILVYLFLKLTLNLPSLQERYGKFSGEIALLSSLIFVAHPIQTQAVSYITQRRASLAALFFLLALYCYAKARLRAGGKKRTGYFAAGVLAMLLAFGSKQNTITLPIFIVLYEYYFWRRLELGKDKKRWLYAIIGLVMSAVLLGLIYTGFNPIHWLNEWYTRRPFTPGQRMLTQLRVVIFYISLLIAPLPSRLNLDHDFPLSYSLLNPPTTLLCLILILGLIAGSIYLAKKRPLISFALIWFWGNLLLESSFLPLELVYEHRLYLPSLGFFIILAIVLIKLFDYVPVKQRVSVQGGVVVLLILLLGYWTYQRNKVWGSAISLWSDAVKKSPNKARPHGNLSAAYAAAGMADKAMEECKKGVMLDPLDYLGHDNLGRLYVNKGLPNEAIRASREALRINPYFMRAHNTLGIAYNQKKMYNAAIKSCLETLKPRSNYPRLYVKPNYVESYFNLGLAYAGKGEYNKAIDAFQKTRELQPNNGNILYHLGDAYFNKGMYDKAIGVFQEAWKLLPNDADIPYKLGNAYFNQGMYAEAKEAYQQALKIKPKLINAYNNLGVIYFNGSQYKAAVEQYQKIIKIVPTHAPAYERLGLIYMDKLKNYKLALFNFKKALEFFKTDKAARLAKESIKRLEAKRPFLKVP